MTHFRGRVGLAGDGLDFSDLHRPRLIVVPEIGLAIGMVLLGQRGSLFSLVARGMSASKPRLAKEKVLNLEVGHKASIRGLVSLFIH